MVVTLPFFDAHFHLTQMAYFMEALDLAGVSTEEVLVSALMEGLTERGVIGYHFVDWNGFRGVDVLDRVSKELPVIVLRTCLHKAWLNSVAINKFGHLLGTLHEDGSIVEGDVWKILDAYFSGKELDRLVKDVIRELQSRGIAGGVEMGVSPEVGRRISQIAHQLGFFYFYYLRDDYDPLDCFGSSSCLGVKLFIDGSLGAETAFIPEGYASGSGVGILLWEDEELFSVVERWHLVGLSVAVHAIGSGAIRQAVGTFRRVLYEFPAPHRHRIEHLQVLYPGAISDMAQLGIIPSIQPTFSHELAWAVKKVPAQLRCGLYRWGDFIRRFPLVLIGTDAPVYGYDPSDTLDGLINASYWKGVGLEPANVELSIALDVMTRHGWRYVGVPVSDDYIRAEWKEFPLELNKLVVGGREVWMA